MACVGKVNRKCYVEAVNLWEHHSTALGIEHHYIRCWEETKLCDAPIAHHMYAVMEAFKKHVQEKHGTYK